MEIIQETIDKFQELIKPAEKIVSELCKKKRILQQELEDLDKVLRKKQRDIQSKNEDCITWCRQNRKRITEELYPKKNTFYKISDVFINDSWLPSETKYFKSRVVQFNPHLDFQRMGDRTFMVRGDAFDADMNLLRESVNIPVNVLREPLKNEIKRIPKKDIDTNVYVMIDTNTGYYKIGRSVNPKIREKTLQSEKPTIEMLFNKKATNKEEKQLHELFKDKRLRGEWFDLTAKDLDTIKEYLN